MIAGRKSSCAVLLTASAALLLATGCGMPGAPLPPTLNLPQPVKDLRAVRNGNQVSLSWSMPRRNTDQMLLKEPMQVWVCRTTQTPSTCLPAGAARLAPGVSGSFQEQLPASWAEGAPRALAYYVQVANSRGRWAGPSNMAQIVAGQAPAAIPQLKADVHKSGVVLHWQPVAGELTPVRLQRRLLTPHPASEKKEPLDAPQEAAIQSLLVNTHLAEGRALDRTVRMGESYEYRAQRVARVTVDGATLELAGGISEPVNVEVRDIFPPDPPQSLAAVATAPEIGTAIDLNWQPNTEADLAGYIVYRREASAEWQRVSPAKLLVAPAFHDAAVQAGHSYQYAVSAVDASGHESLRSAVAEETVPAE